MTAIRIQYFVTFNSPGTLFSEQTTKPIESWDPKLAVKLAANIVERHNAKPYSFYFTTQETLSPIPDGKGGHFKVEPRQTARSGEFFLGGRLRTFDEVKAANRQSEEILRTNMYGNGYWFVIEVQDNYRSTLPFRERDVIVDSTTGEVLHRGDACELVQYRAEKIAMREAAYAAGQYSL